MPGTFQKDNGETSNQCWISFRWELHYSKWGCALLLQTSLKSKLKLEFPPFVSLFWSLLQCWISCWLLFVVTQKSHERLLGVSGTSVRGHRWTNNCISAENGARLNAGLFDQWVFHLRGVLTNLHPLEWSPAATFKISWDCSTLMGLPVPVRPANNQALPPWRSWDIQKKGNHCGMIS